MRCPLPIRMMACALLASALGACNIMPDDRGSSAPGPQPVRPAPTPSAETRACLADLGQAGSLATVVPDRDYGAGCSIIGAVSVSAIAGDDRSFTLTNLGPVTCPVAQTLTGWARYGVDRAARQILGSPLARIETMGSYSCRNVAGSGRRSAHATAQAIDIGGFVLADGRRISVLEDWSRGTEAEQRFLRVVHESACKRFGTVLGPDYNAAHHNHFHVERKGGGFCR